MTKFRVWMTGPDDYSHASRRCPEIAHLADDQVRQIVVDAPRGGGVPPGAEWACPVCAHLLVPLDQEPTIESQESVIANSRAVERECRE
jgi:hypothetical protein